MNKQTIGKINLINKNLYSSQSKEFSNTRNNSWNGWDNIIDELYNGIRILDVACGNGRFVDFIEAKLGKDSNFEYLGIDSSKELISIAKSNYKNEKVKFEIFDLPENFDLENSKYDLIVVFGFMHHIPSKELRIGFLNKLKELLNEEGKIIFSTWNFTNLSLFQNKLDNNEIASLGIEPDELEQNDYFLRWMNKKNIARYSHFYTLDEVRELVSICKMEILNTFEADGKDEKTNIYYVVSKH